MNALLDLRAHAGFAVAGSAPSPPRKQTTRLFAWRPVYVDIDLLSFKCDFVKNPPNA